MRYLPAFSRSFDALLAVKDRDGFNGPVAWLDRRCDELEHELAVLSEETREEIQWQCQRAWENGPRTLAEDCLIAIYAVKKKEKEEEG